MASIALAYKTAKVRKSISAAQFCACRGIGHTLRMALGKAFDQAFKLFLAAVCWVDHGAENQGKIVAFLVFNQRFKQFTGRQYPLMAVAVVGLENTGAGCQNALDI